MWALEMTQRGAPGRTARYSASVISIGVMHSSLRHSQNTVITGPSALSSNASINSAIRSLTSSSPTSARLRGRRRKQIGSDSVAASCESSFELTLIHL